MARRKFTGDVITLDYNGRELVFREDDDEWYCHALKLKAKGLTALKRKVDKLDGETRRVSLPVVNLSPYSSRQGELANVVMIAKRPDWENMRFDEHPDKMIGFHDRRVPTVWVMIPDGNHPPKRSKVRLDDCALQNESTMLAWSEAKQLRAEAERLSKQADAVIAAIPRATMDDLTGKVAEENVED